MRCRYLLDSLLSFSTCQFYVNGFLVEHWDVAGDSVVTQPSNQKGYIHAAEKCNMQHSESTVLSSLESELHPAYRVRV